MDPVCPDAQGHRFSLGFSIGRMPYEMCKAWFLILFEENMRRGRFLTVFAIITRAALEVQNFLSRLGQTIGSKKIVNLCGYLTTTVSAKCYVQ
jgi:hypothetical protein